MGFRFQKRIKIIPGVTLNLSRKGVSTSVGVRGARMTVGHGQTRKTVGLPGSGLSHTTVTRSATGGQSQERDETGGSSVGLILVAGGVGITWLALLAEYPAWSAATYYIALCGVCAVYAYRRGRSAVYWAATATLITPLLAIPLLRTLPAVVSRKDVTE